MSDPAAKRYFTLVAVRLAATAGAVFGLILIARGDALVPKAIGTALVLSALLVMAVVPRALARRWRTPSAETERP